MKESNHLFDVYPRVVKANEVTTQFGLGTSDSNYYMERVNYFLFLFFI